MNDEVFIEGLLYPGVEFRQLLHLVSISCLLDDRLPTPLQFRKGIRNRFILIVTALSFSEAVEILHQLVLDFHVCLELLHSSVFLLFPLSESILSSVEGNIEILSNLELLLLLDQIFLDCVMALSPIFHIFCGMFGIGHLLRSTGVVRFEAWGFSAFDQIGTYLPIKLVLSFELLFDIQGLHSDVIDNHCLYWKSGLFGVEESWFNGI